MMLSFLLLSGCVETDVIDDILMAESEGYDYIGNDKVVGTITMPNYAEGGVSGSGGGGLPSTAAMMNSASTITYDGRSLVEVLQKEGQKTITAGKLRLMLFNQAYLQHGLNKVLHFRNQDPEVGRDLFLAMVDGSCFDLLTGSYLTAIPISRYAYDLIFQNEQKNFPQTNLKSFFYNYYGYQTDPYMPIIKKEKQHLVITGVALLKHDKYAGRIAGENNVFIFKALMETFKYGFYDYEFKPGEHIALENVSSQIKYAAEAGNSPEPRITASLKIIGYIRQGNPLLTTLDYNTSIKKNLQKELESKMETMVSQFQEKRIDPLGLGDLVRSYTRNFNSSSWKDRYPNAHFRAHVTIDIAETGVSK